MPGTGEITRNTVFNEGNIERIKYDPLYQIKVKEGTKHVIYIGRCGATQLHPQLIEIKGVEIKDLVETHEQGEEVLANTTKQEITYPISSVVKISKLPITKA